jgi:hypothetical protein
MYSIGDIIDKLVIENIKIFNIRERLHSENLDDATYANLSGKMMVLNDNKTTLSNLLDTKVEKVVNREEKNRILETIKTF